jgi:uncharacterized protein
MAPVRSQERIDVIDVLRGISILGVILMNMSGYAGYGMAFDGMSGVNRIVVIFLRFFVQAKFYTLLSFLFGWGMAVQMLRAEQRGKPFVPFFLRRLFALLLIGLVHAILIWDGDILVTYALLGFPLLLIFRNRSTKTLLVAAGICISIPVLISLPGPAEDFRNWFSRMTADLLQAMLEGRQADVLGSGSYWEAVAHRWKSLVYGYSQAMYWATHVFGMFLLGLYAGRRRIFQNIPQHLPLFRRVMWTGLIVGVICNGMFTAVASSPNLVSATYFDLATRGARTIGGPALCLFYISAVVLLTHKDIGVRQLSRFAPVGRMAMSTYLTQSIVCTLIFYGYGLGLLGHLGPALALVLSLVIYRIQMSFSVWWLNRYRFGPAEWLWRSLTYGKLQSLKPDPKQRQRTPEIISRVPRRALRVPGWLTFIVRRLTFMVVVAFAIVYFCVLGLRLGANSRSSGGLLSVWDVAEPAFDDTLEYFGNALRGDLGYITQGTTQLRRVPVTELLLQKLSKSASLLAVSIGIATVVGIIAGGTAATRRHSILSLPTLTLTVVGVSIPSFFLALLLQIADIEFFQATNTGLFPIHGINGYRTELLPHIVPPALVLAARPIAHITRIVFIALSEILDHDYIRTARAKGLHPRVVFLEHTLRNAGVSILTAVIVSFRFALGSLPVVEIFFTWPGLGVALLGAISSRELEATATLALSLGLSFLLVNLIVDLMYRFIDPRLRVETNGGAA